MQPSHNDDAFDADDAAAADDEELGVQSKTVHEIVPFRFPLLLSSNGRSGIKREHSEGSFHHDDDILERYVFCIIIIK